MGNAEPFGRNTFNLEELSLWYRQNMKEEGIESLVSGINGTLVEVTCDGGSVLGYLNIDMKEKKYFLTSAKVEGNASPRKYMEDLGLHRVMEESLIATGQNTKKREGIIVTVMGYVGNQDGHTVNIGMDGIYAGLPLEVTTILRGRHVTIAGYANHIEMRQTTKAEFHLQSYNPHFGHHPNDTCPISIDLSYETADTLTKNNTFRMTSPLMPKA